MSQCVVVKNGECRDHFGRSAVMAEKLNAFGIKIAKCIYALFPLFMALYMLVPGPLLCERPQVRLPVASSMAKPARFSLPEPHGYRPRARINPFLSQSKLKKS